MSEGFPSDRAGLMFDCSEGRLVTPLTTHDPLNNVNALNGCTRLKWATTDCLKQVILCAYEGSAPCVRRTVLVCTGKI